MSLFFIITGALFAVFLAGFATTSLLEKERRASAVALAFLLLFCALWITAGLAFPEASIAIAAAAWIASALGAAFMALPIGRAEPLEINEDKTERLDERHTMFGRDELTQGTAQYKEYYESMNPGAKEMDDSIRSLPELGAPGGKYADEIDSLYMRSVFDYIEKYNYLADPGEPSGKPVKVAPEAATHKIKAFAKHMGAFDVRVTRLKPYHVYSHAGRHQENWGEEIHLDHRFAIVFSLEMDPAMVHTAPLNPTSTETAVKYMHVQNIAIALATFIKNLGYPARAHVDANYQVICTAIAHDAGLGEIGRLGLLVTPRLGPRVRLGVVTTDLELAEDKRINLGVQHFCTFCRKCAANCPSQSIETGDKKTVRGVRKWQSTQEACRKLWRRFGTDCAVCVAVCPYSKPNTFYHNLIRFFIKRNSLARRIALLMDDVFYGRRPGHTAAPDWFTRG